MTRTLVAALSAALAFAAATAMAQSGDASGGERLFNQQCKACHTIAKDGRNTIGPNLFGLLGRKAGAAKDFGYSEAMTKSGIVWNDKTLGDYLKDPKGRVPGTKMAYAGLKQPQQLGDMLAYLRKATQ